MFLKFSFSDFIKTVCIRFHTLSSHRFPGQRAPQIDLVYKTTLRIKNGVCFPFFQILSPEVGTKAPSHDKHSRNKQEN